MAILTARIRVTKKFNFDMAHALHGHDGPCKNIHGHSYHLYVTLRGVPRYSTNHPKDGMVIDFTELKSRIEQSVIKLFDHALVLNECSFPGGVDTLKKQFEKIILVPYQPSCENLVIDFKDRIKKVLEETGLELFSLRLDETATSFAEWYAEDNE